METKACAKAVRVSPRKVRLVLDNIRGKSVTEATAILKFTRTGSAVPIAKVLKSAINNAVNNHDADEKDLYVIKCYADEGQVLKRWMPRAKGNAAQILKRSSHITIVVGDKKEEVKDTEAKEVKAEVKDSKKEAKKAEVKKPVAKKETKKEAKEEKKPAKKTVKKEPAKKTAKKPAKKADKE